MTTTFTKYAVFIITILTANYLGELFFKFTNSYQNKNYTSVLIGMAIIVLIYVPVFGFLEKYIKKISQTYVTKSKKAASNSFIGLVIGFGIAFLLLFYAYAKLWFNLDILKTLF